MTQKQFKEAMLRGQGRCVQAMLAEPERFAPTVLWACSHEIFFDAQCEGTRAAYVYQMICCCRDKAPFLARSIECLKGINLKRHWNGWKLQFDAELLDCFARDGDEAAEQALWDEYDAMLSALANGARPNRNGIFPLQDSFESLCLLLGRRDRTTREKIAADIGTLYQSGRFFGSDFMFLYDTWEKSLRGRRKRLSESVKTFLEVGERREQEREANRRDRERERPDHGIALSGWLRHRGDPETVRAYADAYLQETDPAKRAEALEAFCICPFPGDPQPLLEDAESENEKLRSAAQWALTKVRHPSIRAFALARLESEPEDALPLLLMNYQEEDERRVTELVRAIPVERDGEENWHSIHLDVLNMADHGLRAPGELLRHIWETTYCPCCRSNAVRQLGRRRLLTDEMLQESLFDSYVATRRYARQCLRRREKK